VRISEINMLHRGSTGNIMFSIANKARAFGHDVQTYSPIYFHKNTVVEYPTIESHTYFGSRNENYLHVRLAQITGFHGCFSIIGTFRLLKALDSCKPDILHLHNLHNWSINIPMLFSYIKRKNIRAIWTLHDCWSFTGHCPHFQVAKCDKWKTGCHHCPSYRDYPQSFVDNSKRMYKLKKKWFTGIPNLTLVSPSGWLAGLVKESFLKDYPVKVINNGIDLSIFKPRENSFREKHGITQDKHIVLGVAFGWGYKKGLDVFLKLSEKLGKDYQVVLVGTDDTVDRKLPENIISIHRTHNQTELAEIYSAADVFANPTREETFPTVNMESLACGTPVITFETGGSPEILDETCGIVVPCDDVDAMKRAIRHVCEDKPFSQEACLKRAGSFSMQEKFQEYVELYEQIVK